jgi:hypothetical protein
MPDQTERTINRYRRWYRTLLRLHPRAHRERFAESMEQTFHDLCRERAATGKGLLGFAMWLFLETSTGIIKENARSIMTHNKNIVRIAIGTGLILMIPLIAMQVSDEWNWGPLDFVFAGILLFGTGLVFDLVARKCSTIAYRAAVAIACVTGFLLLWVNAAVGFIGDEDAANAMYLGVLAVGFIGALLARFEPRGMSLALVATAVAQALVPLIAMTWVPEDRFDPGYVPVLCLNAVFVALWLASALLFRYAAEPRSKTGGEPQASTANS